MWKGMRMSDFVKEIHNMFDHIWDCEIDHPAYQDTVGELMEAVIQTYEKHKPTLSTNLAEVGTDAVSRKAVKELAYSQIRSMYCGVALKEQRETMLRIADNVIGLLAPVASKQPEIVRCKDCKHYGRADKRRFFRGYDCLDGRIASIVPDKDFCSRAERREVTE